MGYYPRLLRLLIGVRLTIFIVKWLCSVHAVRYRDPPPYRCTCLKTFHAYAIMDIEEKPWRVRLRDPYGPGFQLTGKEWNYCSENAGLPSDGSSWLSGAEFLHYVGRIVFKHEGDF